MPSIIMSMNSSQATLLTLDKISVSKHGKRILDEVSLSVSRGEIVTLIGPNGSGKSTLVKAALGLVCVDSGNITQASSALSIGYVPQNIKIDSTLPMNVLRFMRLYFHWHKNLSAQKKNIINALTKTGAEHLLNAPMHALSGGEMRRVLLARALLCKPDLLILDEPTAGVDINGQAALYALIQQLRDALNCGVLLVSHDLHIVMKASNKVICLNQHLCCSGLPADVSQNPEFVQLFGQQLANELAIYHHQHDHEHGLHGEICQTKPAPEARQHG